MWNRWLNRVLDAVTSRLPLPEQINGAERCPTYLYRWELASLLGGSFRLYLHKFVGDDWALDLHDHPKRFVSIGLLGWYDEMTDRGGVRRFRAPWIRSFPAEHRHRLMGPTDDRPCWTLVAVGPPTRTWGFWRDGGFVAWRAYVSRENGWARVSCGGDGGVDRRSGAERQSEVEEAPVG